MWNKYQNLTCQNHTFENLCVYIFEPQIYILLFNKLDSYKVLIDYKNFQAGFSDSEVECFELQCTLEPSTPSFRGRNLLIFLNPETHLKHLNWISTK